MSIFKRFLIMSDQVGTTLMNTYFLLRAVVKQRQEK